jgi:succinate dehydrogenase / fumarate reductase membrane anchor subunit
MAYLTDRKRADGLGSSKSGTEHFWNMQVSAVALAILIPLFIFTFGRILGASHAEVVAYFARPFPAIVTGLTLVVGLVHFKNGAQVMIEDYAQGLTRKVLIMGTICLSYACIAVGLFALIRLAL